MRNLEKDRSSEWSGVISDSHKGLPAAEASTARELLQFTGAVGTETPEDPQEDQQRHTFRRLTLSTVSVHGITNLAGRCGAGSVGCQYLHPPKRQV